jgi:hypothetical protein
MIGLRLVDPISKIEKDIQAALIGDLNVYLNKNKNVAVGKLKQASKSWVLSQLEMQSLQDSSIPYSLNSLFGIPKGTEADVVDRVADAVANSIQVKFSKIDKNFKGGLTFSIQPSDFQNLLGLSEGHVTTEKGTDLHWLSWLLTEGDSVIVAGYQYDASGSGRSGVGSMAAGSSFRVPPAYSGTTSNNFVTRAFVNKQKEIERIISEVFK